jgi:hypothetical protein
MTQAVPESQESAFSCRQSLLVFNRFDREYTEGATKKHRPKERCRVLDKYDTTKMRSGDV